jgi:enoyl-CoA hydratase
MAADGTPETKETGTAWDGVGVERAGPLATLTLDRPENLNPLDWATVKALRAAFAELDADGDLRVVLITGRGRAFSAGGDLKGYLELYRQKDDFRRFLEDFRDLNAAIEASAKMVIAVVNGFCVAGGLELMLACDLAIAAETAKIGDGHLNFGQLPGAGGSQRLPRAVGVGRAKDLILTGRLVDGREALRLGLVQRAVPGDKLMAEARALAQTFLEKSPLGLAQAKRLVNQGMSMGRAEAIDFEMDMVHEYASESFDATEGLRAFAEKRKPDFKGR